MQLRYCTPKNPCEDAISPVVGVMLMLVVTIILAAVVSAFSGGTVNANSKAPSASVEIHVKNGGTDDTSYFSMKVLGVSEPIPTKNLQLITAWQTTDKSSGSSGAGISGGNTSVTAGKGKVSVIGEQAGTSGSITVPTGHGNGVKDWATDTDHPKDAMWGNFSLSSGVSTFDRPSGYGTNSVGKYAYPAAHGQDPMTSILGDGWNNLRAGDTVAVRIIDTKSGKTLVDQNVIVEG